MSPIQIPPELIENVARGSCVLFFGADVSYDAEDWVGPPSRPQLAAALAQKYAWVRPGQTFGLAVDEYLSREPPDYHGLVSFVIDQVSGCVRPGPVHRLLVDLGFDAIVTNGYDELLKTAMREAGRRVLQVVGDEEVAYAGGQEEAILIHLAGTVERPDSLILTRRDQIRVENHLSEKLQAVRGWCALRPLLFIGWDPDDDGLQRLYYAATEKLGRHKRRNIIVWPEPSARAVSNWRQDNVEIIPAEPLLFLRALERLARQQRPLGTGYRPGQVVGKLPYKFLDYFDPQDRDIFCGREVEAPLVYRMALSYPILTLFGQSGVGKTSLLRAGVMPLLAEEGYSYAYVRALGNPVQAIREEVCRALGLKGCGGETLRDFFRAALGEDGRLVVILDQLEELFIRAGRATRRQFWREVSDCQGMAGPEVRFVLALREDYLPELDEARRPLEEGQPAPIPAILRDSYRLTGLVADTAYLAIVEPARRARCAIEPQLAEVLLGRAPMPSVGAGLVSAQVSAHWSLAEADGTVPPPALQIVMDRLYRQAMDEAGHRLPPAGALPPGWQPPALMLTLALYGRLGGAGRILGDYVTAALDEVPKRGGDRALAEALLKVMVTGQRTKAALDHGELVAGMAEADPDFDPGDAAGLARLRATRAALVNLRLVREFERGGAALYELAHDHMAAEIATWIGEQEMQAKLARELLRREMESWRGLGKLIEPGALRLIHERRDDLRRLNGGELELLLRSALAAGCEAAYWFERARQGGVNVDEIALEGLKSESFRTRAAAVAALGQLGGRFAEPIMGMLGDLYPQVRAAAIAALERLQPDGAWRVQLKYECYVPAGEFVMGEDPNAHPVSLNAFYIGKYPVTNAEYRRYKEDVGQPFEMPPGKADHPVVNVSWYDARDYAAWAGMRLLTEAEWEKAASWDVGAIPGGRPRKRRYPWGDQFDKNRCNTSESGIGTTTPVGRYSPQGDSPCGAADMAGNVWEWTSSLCKNYPYQAGDGREDMTSFDGRVLRGGSWDDDAGDARAACRNSINPGDRGGDNGFRLGASAPFSPRSGL